MRNLLKKNVYFQIHNKCFFLINLSDTIKMVNYIYIKKTIKQANGKDISNNNKI